MGELEHPASASQGRGYSPATAPVPDMPEIPPAEQYTAIPFPLVDLPRTIGWQWLSAKKGGPSFVLISSSRFSQKVTGRFPLTEQGWAAAWHALERLDPEAARKCRIRLSARLAGQRGRGLRPAELVDLVKRTLAAVREVALLGGYAPEAAIVVGERYDVRFLEGSLAVFAPAALGAAPGSLLRRGRGRRDRRTGARQVRRRIRWRRIRCGRGS